VAVISSYPGRFFHVIKAGAEFERVLVSAPPRCEVGEIDVKDRGQYSDRAQIYTYAGAVHHYLLAEQRLNEIRMISRENTHRLPR
jgi:hypothetical protein